jgi:hypothetical protein
VTTIQLQGVRPATAADAVSTRLTTTVLDQSARVAASAAAAAIPPITMLHLEATDSVDPVSWTISDYVVSLPHGITLFGMTAAALAIGGGALAHGLRLLAGTRTIRTLLTIWSIAAVTAAVFPTNLRGTAENMSSTIHLVAGGVVFAILPIAGYLLARIVRRVQGRTVTTVVLTATSAVNGVLSTALILNRLPATVGMPELMLPPGILQRVAGAMQIVLLAVAAITLLRTRQPATTR